MPRELSLAGMKSLFLIVLLALASIQTAHVAGQTLPEQKPTEAEIPASKRRFEVLQHPRGIITIRLAPAGADGSPTPRSERVDAWMHFEMFISLTSGEDLTYIYSRNHCYAYRPELIRDGDVVFYSKEAQECVARAEREPGGDGFSDAPEPLTAGREYLSHTVNLDDWYETPLKPGHYQLLVRKQFLPALPGVPGGDWVESNPVTFDVIPREPAAPIKGAGEPDLDQLDVKLKSHIGKNMPGWSYRRIEPIQGSSGVSVDFWFTSNRNVKISTVAYLSAERAKTVLQDFAKYEPNREELKGFGEDAFSWGYGHSNVVFRRGRFIIYVSTYADVASDSDVQSLTREQKNQRERSEMKRLSVECARHAT